MTEQDQTSSILLRIQARIARACERAGRDPSSVTLIGASKTVQPARLKEFLQCGLADLGENYVQEGIAKQRELEAEYSNVRWHFIGALQSNKAREAMRHFDWIHSVDRVSLARALHREAEKHDKRQPVLLQVNLGHEETKAGCEPGELPDLARLCAEFSHLQVRGLMALPPYQPDPEKSRLYFRQLRDLLNTTRDLHPQLGDAFNQLSMGMSNNFEVAIEEGATFVRIGTELFGVRGPK